MSVGNLGYYSLIFCFLFSISSLYFSYKETKFGKSKISTRIFISSLFQLITIFFAFFCLIYSFLVSDFSIITVYENSNANTPLFYKISGTWGNHEGSLLLWMIVLILFSFLFLITSNKEPIKYPNKPPKVENIVAIKNIFKYSSFFANDIGIIITSGGIGKKELSAKETTDK